MQITKKTGYIDLGVPAQEHLRFIQVPVAPSGFPFQVLAAPQAPPLWAFHFNPSRA